MANSCFARATLALLFACPLFVMARTGQAASLEAQVGALLDAVSQHRSTSGPTHGTSTPDDSFTIAIAHNRDVTVNTLKAVKSAFETNRDARVRGRKIAFVMIPFRDASELKKRILKAKAEAVFIPEANDRSVRVILSVTRRLQLLSFTNMPNYVHWLGVTLGVDSSESQLRIMVNLAGCQHEKVEFDEKILGSAQVFF